MDSTCRLAFGIHHALQAALPYHMRLSYTAEQHVQCSKYPALMRCRQDTCTSHAPADSNPHQHFPYEVPSLCQACQQWSICLQRVLICGFGSFTFMVELIRALDHELPRGSDLTLFSERTTRDTIGTLCTCRAHAARTIYHCCCDDAVLTAA